MSSLRLALKQSLQESAATQAPPPPPPEQGGNFSSEHEFSSDSESEQEQQHDAANKIQSKWKSSKRKRDEYYDETTGSSAATTAGAAEAATGHRAASTNAGTSHATGAAAGASTSTTTTALHTSSQHERAERKKSKQPKQRNKKHESDDDDQNQKGRKSKTVLAPSHEHIEWMHLLPSKKARKHVAPGLRVKVRFATLMGNKSIGKKKWFGGRISAVSKQGSKVRIKYDDGTTEVTRFPDKDVIVDDTMNGAHSCNAERFIPPNLRGNAAEGRSRAILPRPLSPQEGNATAAASTSPKQQHQLQHTHRPTSPRAAQNVHSSTPNSPRAHQRAPHSPKQMSPLRKSPPQSPRGAKKAAKASSGRSHDDKGHSMMLEVEAASGDKPHSGEVQKENVGKTVLLHGKKQPATQESDPGATKASEPYSKAITAGSSKTLLQQHQQEQTEEATKRHSAAAISTGVGSPAPVKRKRGRPPKHRPPGYESPKLSPKRTHKPASSPKLQSPSSGTSKTPKRETAITSTTSQQEDHKPVLPELPNLEASTSKESLPPVAQEQTGAMEEAVPSGEAKRDEPTPEAEDARAAPEKVANDLSAEVPVAESTVEDKEPVASVEPSAEVHRESPKEVPATTREKATSKPSLTIRIPNKIAEGSELVKAEAGPVKQSEATNMESSKKMDSAEVVDSKESCEQREIGTSIVSSAEAEKDRDHSEVVNAAIEAAGKVRSSDTHHRERSRDSVEADDDVEQPPPKRIHIHIGSKKLTSEKDSPIASEEVTDTKKNELEHELMERQVDEATNTKEGKTSNVALAESSFHSKKQKRKRVHPDSSSSIEADLPSHKRKRSKEHLSSKFVDQTAGIQTPVLSKRMKDIAEGSELAAADTADEAEMEMDLYAGSDSLAEQLTPRGRKNLALDNAPIVRSGRRAAQQANERIVSRQEHVIESETGKKGKKKRDKRRDGETGVELEQSESSEDDSQWVQCDKCGKWRIIPTIVVATLPKQWFCADNVWDPKRASCDAPEQTPKQAAKEKKRRKKLQHRLRMEAAAAAAAAENAASGEADSEIEKPRSERSRSPRPPEPEPETKHRRPSPDLLSEGDVHSHLKPEKEKKLSSQGKKIRSNNSSEGLPVVGEVTEVKQSRGRGRPRRNKEPSTAVGKVSTTQQSSQVQVDEADNLEWVQCEKCEKWRKLPAHISADELPEVWYCALNTWNPSSASCDAPEDKADGLQDVGFHSGTGAGKLSYRNLIFGSTGRKPNRPVSERTRAAESLFLAPNDDEDAPPTVMYANSSAFVARSRSTPAVDENERLSVLELMSHSNLWAELRAAAQPLGQHKTSLSSGGVEKPPNLSFYTFDTLPLDIQHQMKELVLGSLGDKTLSGDEVLLEAQCRKAEPDKWPTARAYCTINVIVTTLCQLSKEGAVECLQEMGPNWTMKDWNPRYRVSRRRSCGVDKSASRCTLMKISKPWKKRARGVQ